MHSIPVHLSSGKMTVGYYTIANGYLVMIGNDGDELRRHKLRTDDNIKALATVFTKEIRSTMVKPFWDDISMPVTGIA